MTPCKRYQQDPACGSTSTCIRQMIWWFLQTNLTRGIKSWKKTINQEKCKKTYVKEAELQFHFLDDKNHTYSGGVGQDRIVFGSRQVVSEVASYSLLIWMVVTKGLPYKEFITLSMHYMVFWICVVF